jgi:hypothetical protein
MRALAQKRRLATALLAGLVLCASLASAGHAHAAAVPEAGAVAAREAQPLHAGLASGELDCALCAAGARLGHGAASTHPCAAVAPRCAPASRAAAILAPRWALFARALSRAPPRLG